ncbi:putative required for meiotic nuclear division protein 1-like [Apostichopus japonicus]|uniref:Putative required for meiotic nuclear division protein 1-like n=1 Tax=Stichopus japonicus TaxID=307972 RepID=A0A2G8KUG8_STIJA|nr:putative required for meiotic nuclear division protein 1-like [Apostichopus japonicus]
MHRPQHLTDNIIRSSSTHLSSVKAPTSAKTSKASKPARPRTKKPSTLVLKDEGQWLSTAFSTSEEFNLEHFSLDLQTQGNFQVATMPTDAHDVLHMKVITDTQEDEEPSEMFIFRNGCLVFWNVAESTIKQVMKIATKHQSEPYEVALVNWENEQMNYSYGEGKTCFKEDCIVLNGNSSTEVTTLEKFAFSNSMILSVKLAMWEYTLDKFVSSIEHIPEILKASGKLKMSHKSTMKHMGKLYSLRHRINLSSDLLNTPDFYWDRQELEDLFTKMCQFFSISRRTRVMNDKLSHCNDLMDLMRNDVTEQHTLRLEAMITILIGVEIIIEIIHYTV